MKCKLILLVILTISLVNSCDLFNQNPPQNTDPVDNGSLLIIDEANQIMNIFDLANESLIYHSYIGPAANQILVDGDTAFLAVSLSHTILKIDLKNGGAPDTYGFFGTPNPYSMAIDESRLYVTLLNNNQMAVFDKYSMALLTNLDLPSGNYPQGIVVSSNNIYIATSIGYLSWGNTGNYTNAHILIMDKSDYSFVTNISVHTNPHSLLLKDESLYISCPSQYNGNGAVQRIILSNYSLENLDLIDASTPGYLNWDESRLFITDDPWSGTGGLYIWNSLDDSTNHILAGTGLKGISFTGGFIYCSSGYGGNILYKIDKTDYDNISIISNVGGGDMALYE